MSELRRCKSDTPVSAVEDSVIALHKWHTYERRNVLVGGIWQDIGKIQNREIDGIGVTADLSILRAWPDLRVGHELKVVL